MELGLLGSGPAAAAIAAACEDIDLGVRRLAPDSLTASVDTVDEESSTTADESSSSADSSITTDDSLPAVGAVVAPAGAAVFSAANRHFERWVAVEIGGLGGRPIESLDASVSLYGPDSACYRCLHTRVAAHAEGSETPEQRGSRPAVRLAGALAGNHLVSLLAGETTGGRVVEVPGPERELLAVPHCACESNERTLGAFDLSHREVDVDTSLTAAERAVDERLGLLGSVGERESFPVPYYIAEIADTTGFSDARAAQFAAGVDPDWDRAYMKALGEALERYSAGVYREADLAGGSERTMSKAVSPRTFVCPEGFETPDPETRLQWVEGRTLPGDDRVSLPASFVLFPPPARRFRPAITTGLGLGNTTVEATLSGLYEVIERDATMIGWYSTFEPLGLAVEDERIAACTKRARAESLSVTTLLLTQDVDVPVVASAVHREGEWPRFAVGSAANLDPAVAAGSALTEALQNWMELRAMGPEAAAEEGGAIAEYADFPPAARRFVDPADRIPASALGDPDVSGRAELEAVCARLSAVDLSAHAVRLTPRDVAGLGFEAVRVVVPAAQPLFTGEPFFGERAQTVPASLGFEPRLERSYHPFP